MLETTPSPRWQRRPDERPDEILDAALEVFGAQGFAGARLEDIARQAGVSKGTLYLYFDSKEALFRAMVRARVVSVLEEGERELLHAKGTACLAKCLQTLPAFLGHAVHYCPLVANPIPDGLFRRRPPGGADRPRAVLSPRPEWFSQSLSRRS